MSIRPASLRLSQLTDDELISFAGRAESLHAEELEQLARELLLRGLVQSETEASESPFREQHVAFAYRFIPRLCFRQPRQFFSKLLAEGRPMLVALWNQLGARLALDAPMAPEGLTLRRHRGAVFDGIQIILPRPLHETEATDVLLTFRAAGSSYAELGYYVRESGTPRRLWEIQFDGARTEHPAPKFPRGKGGPGDAFWRQVLTLRGVVDR